MADEKQKQENPVEAEPTEAEKAAKAEADRADRVKALIAGYELALKHNAPRTLAELNEIKALLA